MRLVLVFLTLISAVSAFAQAKPEVLATSTAATFTSDSLTPEIHEAWDNRDTKIAEARTNLLAEMVAQELLDMEAKAQNTTVEKLAASVTSKMSEPTADQIQAVYDANKKNFGDTAPDDARTRIVKFLKQNESAKLLQAFVTSLDKKYGVTYGKDVNAKPLLPTDVLAKFGTTTITVKTFDDVNRIAIAKAWYEIYAQMRADLDTTIYTTLVNAEAAVGGIDSSEYISREITAKVRDYSEEERAALEDALQKRLFAKYKVRFVTKEPVLGVQKISVDDDYSTGALTAPVTVVMFTDFQCPACSRSHPVIMRVLAEYGNKVRFVVRDFPLESLHENAFLAARAAYAANAQGKFAVYTEKLYHNQYALDRDSLIKYAGELGLNVKQFELDFSSERSATEIRKDIADGKSYGIGGTPAVFVNGISVWPLAWELRRAIDRSLGVR
ncbi:MAG TPA: thioredoxin domain-containing protein [Pyrinomonadaceae bacterium]|jgi:protein-disulfide isomerase|nr:thioredoxin domain-containing protein [Pyrinomonadaceae bacterium]